MFDIQWPVYGAYASEIVKRNKYSGFNMFSRVLLLTKQCDYNVFFYKTESPGFFAYIIVQNMIQSHLCYYRIGLFYEYRYLATT